RRPCCHGPLLGDGSPAQCAALRCLSGLLPALRTSDRQVLRTGVVRPGKLRRAEILLPRVRRLTFGRLAIAGWLAVTRRRSLEGSCLLPRPERREIAEESGDHEDRKYEGVEEDQVVPAREEEQKVEAVDRKARSEDGIPYSPCRGLATLDARYEEHRDATEDEEQYIELEHVGTPPACVGLPRLGR